MNIKMLKVAFASLFLSVCCFANAGLITDTANDSFIDESTGLEWMDFGVNNGVTYTYVVEQLAAGGIYDLWRLPTEAEVKLMFTNAFVGLGADNYSPNYWGTGWGRVQDSTADQAIGSRDSVFAPLLDIMGVNLLLNQGTNREYTSSNGRFAGDNGAFSYLQIADVSNSFPDYYSDSVAQLTGPNRQSSIDETDLSFSTLLVKKTNSVPEPSSLAIFGLAILGLAYRKLKKK